MRLAIGTYLISFDFAQKILVPVHSFTAVGLEAQATAFSFKADGVMIKCLALLKTDSAAKLSLM